MSFGVSPPDDAVAYYGCRAIDHGDTVDVPHDRQTFTGEDETRKAMARQLGTALKNHVARYVMNEMNAAGKRTGEYSERVGPITITARRDGGYIHVGVHTTTRLKMADVV